jgi:hypothetical protein
MSKEKKLQIRNSTAEFLIFTRQAGEDGIEVRVQDETVWLTQKLMAALFGVDVRTISEHLRNLFDSGEAREDSVIRKFRTTAADGKNYNTQFYNLDAIIAVGFRVNSARAIQFRQWATGVLRDYAIRGYVLDKERLKNGSFFNQAYFENLLAEIREIRASERKFYQKITDIYATAMDYSAEAEPTSQSRLAARRSPTTKTTCSQTLISGSLSASASQRPRNTSTPPPSRPVSRSTRSSHTRGTSASTAWASKISKRVSASRRTNSSSIAPAVPSWP